MSNKKDHQYVERLGQQYKNAPREAQREVARGIGIGTVGVGKDTTAANAQAYKGNISSDSGVSKFQSAGMGPK
ncbi:unnamed protein product [Nezara viridula]|uniref:Uncharacterized protein n=1 Tax=Nezara viridula TaxID=85310 RepID=A0A9P0HG17_NEZVI|nr:unnamed protein product [Nezara viridula]